MCGSGNHGAFATYILNDGNGQCCAFRRVGSGAELVKEDEGMLVALGEDADDIGHVSRESGEILLDALLIPDISEDKLNTGRVLPSAAGI